MIDDDDDASSGKGKTSLQTCPRLRPHRITIYTCCHRICIRKGTPRYALSTCGDGDGDDVCGEGVNREFNCNYNPFLYPARALSDRSTWPGNWSTLLRLNASAIVIDTADDPKLTMCALPRIALPDYIRVICKLKDNSTCRAVSCQVRARM